MWSMRTPEEPPGAHHRGYVLLRVPERELSSFGLPDKATQILGAMLKPGERRPFTLSRSPCVAAGEAEVSRLDVVRYVANKLGGVHLDAGRAPLGNQWVRATAFSINST